MAVIALPQLSTQGQNPSQSWELRTLSKIQRSPFNAVTTSLERPGDHWAATLNCENLADSRRARWRSWVTSMRGHVHRCYVPYFGYVMRGSFPATELLTNNTFASGTTGWACGTETALTASDGMLRATRIAVLNGQSYGTQTVALTQFAPYALRTMIHAGRGGHANVGSYFFGTASNFNTGVPGYRTATMVPGTTTNWGVGAVDFSGSGLLAGDYVETSYMSCARCALVDNGTNSCLQSDTLQTTWATNQAVVTPNAITAPGGTTTADNISDNGVNADHYIGQTITVPAAAADYAYFGSFRGSGIVWVQVRMATATGDVRVWINLTNGAIATTTTGSGWANTRVFVTSQGDSWYRVHLVSSKTSADTSLTAYVRLATGDGVTAYAGVGSGLNAWRVGVSPSSVPSRGAQTTTTALASGTSQTGSALYLKGLPASTNGLLLVDDLAEIILPAAADGSARSQLVRLKAPLNSDAAGLGYMQFEPPLRASPADSAGVIVVNPLCRMMMDAPVNGWMDHAPSFSDLSFTAVEDIVQ